VDIAGYNHDEMSFENTMYPAISSNGSALG
jgi:hypothetical protein